MPLMRDPHFKPVFHKKLRGLAIQMVSQIVSQGDEAPRPIRVIVTFQALASMSETHIEVLPAALQCLERLRERIEIAASVKFDRIGPNIEEYEGVPTFLSMTGDSIGPHDGEARDTSIAQNIASQGMPQRQEVD